MGSNRGNERKPATRDPSHCSPVPAAVKVPSSSLHLSLRLSLKFPEKRASRGYSALIARIFCSSRGIISPAISIAPLPNSATTILVFPIRSETTSLVRIRGCKETGPGSLNGPVLPYPDQTPLVCPARLQGLPFLGERQPGLCLQDSLGA